jgi:MFS transporter, ACS family, D-galactonate transporter
VTTNPDPLFTAQILDKPDGSSRARWGIVLMLMAFACVSHFNRVSIATAGNTRIMQQYGISPTRMGMIYSAFLVTYTVCMIPGGLLIDRLGAKAALMTVGFGSAFFVAMTGSVGLRIQDAWWVFVALLIVRGLMGIVSAPLHPALARSVGDWVAPRKRSRTNGLVNGSALLGIAVTPHVFGALIDRFDWPAAFLIMGGLTAGLALVWTTYATNRPVEPDWDEAATLPDKASEPHVAWHLLFTQKSLMLLTFSYAAVNYFQYLFFYWINFYLATVLKLPEHTTRIYAAIPALAMAVGMPLGGWLSDRLEHARGTSSSRRFVPMVGMSAGALFLILGVLAREPAWIVTYFALALGAVGMSEGPFWASAVELGGRRGGSSAALFNTGGNAGGLLAPVVTPWVGERLGWPSAVGLGGLICLVGVVLWFWIDLDERPGVPATSRQIA